MFNSDNNYNQFEKMAQRLIKNPESKSATISFIYLSHDDKHMPCILSSSFMQVKCKADWIKILFSQYLYALLRPFELRTYVGIPIFAISLLV